MKTAFLIAALMTTTGMQNAHAEDLKLFAVSASDEGPAGTIKDKDTPVTVRMNPAVQADISGEKALTIYRFLGVREQMSQGYPTKKGQRITCWLYQGAAGCSFIITKDGNIR